RIPFSVRSERQVIGHACGLDTRNRANAVEDLLEDLAAFDLAGFASWRAVVILDFDGGGAVGLKPEINIEHLHKTAQQQPRAHQQHASQSYFEDDQRGADPLVLASQSRSRTGILEHLL